MKKLYSTLSNRTFLVLFALLLLFVIAIGNKRESTIIYNANGTKSLEAVHIVTKYNAIEEKLEPVFVETMKEVAEYGPNKPVAFSGQMTAYGPDCVGCTGRVSCPPRPNIKNSITFQDVDYGEVRILAADRAIPCGTIIRITNLTFGEEQILGIVLDRGGAIQGKIIDYLIETEKLAGSYVGRQKNAQFEIVRWGW